jgi:hypothetical protein
MKKLTFILLLISLFAGDAFGQMARKPSPMREPRGAMS